jgi:hypothetical protein
MRLASSSRSVHSADSATTAFLITATSVLIPAPLAQWSVKGTRPLFQAMSLGR